MTGKEIIRKTVMFEGPSRLPRVFPQKYGSDIYFLNMNFSPDARKSRGTDEWGAVWDNVGVCSLGEVKVYPLENWDNLKDIRIPDVNQPARWEGLTAESVEAAAAGKFILAGGLSIYERVHFLRGLENTWADIYEDPEKLCELLDILTDMNISAIKRYSELGADGYFFCDDWGLQNQLMISPVSFRKLWKPRYERIYRTAHDYGMLTFLHSCGYIVEILDDLIEAGLDVIHMDQQQNMGLELLGKRFGGRLTFYAPVDIQNTMVKGTIDEIRAYCHKMVELLGRPEGGFIPTWYGSPSSVGHREEAIDAMCQEFINISKEIYGE